MRMRKGVASVVTLALLIVLAQGAEALAEIDRITKPSRGTG